MVSGLQYSNTLTAAGNSGGFSYAGLVELADTSDLSSDAQGVGFRVPYPAPWLIGGIGRHPALKMEVRR